MTNGVMGDGAAPRPIAVIRREPRKRVGEEQLIEPAHQSQIVIVLNRLFLPIPRLTARAAAPPKSNARSVSGVDPPWTKPTTGIADSCARGEWSEIPLQGNRAAGCASG